VNIEKIVIDAIKSINEDLGSEKLSNPTMDTELFSELDSMAVLDLILEIEEAIERESGSYIQIANDKIMDIDSTPFKSVKSAIEYIESKVNNGKS